MSKTTRSCVHTTSTSASSRPRCFSATGPTPRAIWGESVQDGSAGRELLALRLGLLRGRISEATFKAAVAYRSPIPLFESGAEAADHGQADIRYPTPIVFRAIAKITRRRSRLG